MNRLPAFTSEDLVPISKEEIEQDVVQALTEEQQGLEAINGILGNLGKDMELEGGAERGQPEEGLEQAWPKQVIAKTLRQSTQISSDTNVANIWNYSRRQLFLSTATPKPKNHKQALALPKRTAVSTHNSAVTQPGKQPTTQQTNHSKLISRITRRNSIDNAVETLLARISQETAD
ncbi:hypothetical protein PCASD_20854 [Puccinia coronata f. sp. avenae]|uniref:Uncharacterized protein n=1 Tax=Puccinia coronata f. sp. avenae TaxID=200324 RepID=A0A2N5U5D0_9BASI|nr:hypothetical protein PCASD_20854 [Puccinia coronata f. sp. avenae]